MEPPGPDPVMSRQLKLVAVRVTVALIGPAKVTSAPLALPGTLTGLERLMTLTDNVVTWNKVGADWSVAVIVTAYGPIGVSLPALIVTVAMPPWPGKLQVLALHVMLALFAGGAITQVGIVWLQGFFPKYSCLRAWIVGGVVRM